MGQARPIRAAGGDDDLQPSTAKAHALSMACILPQILAARGLAGLAPWTMSVTSSKPLTACDAILLRCVCCLARRLLLQVLKPFC